MAEAIKEKEKEGGWGGVGGGWRGDGKTVLILDLVLFLRGSTGGENTGVCSRGEEKESKSPFMLLKISGARTKVTSERATAGILALFAVI